MVVDTIITSGSACKAKVASAHLDLSKMGQRWGILSLRELEAEQRGHQWRRQQLLAASALVAMYGTPAP